MTTTPEHVMEPQSPRTPAAGRPPVGAPAVGYVGSLIALLLLVAGVVALRDSAVFAGWLDGRPFTSTLVDAIDGLTVQWWTSPLGVAAIVVGVWWVYAAVRPRRRTAVPVTNAETSVWVAPRDLARIASAAADDVPGVLEARSSATLRKVTVVAQVTAETDGGSAEKEMRTAVAGAAAAAVRDLISSPPRISVRVRTGGR